MILDAEADMDVVGEAANGKEASRRPAASGRRRADGRADAGARRDRGDETPACGRRRRFEGRDVTTFDMDEYVYEPCGPVPAASCSRTLRRSSSSTASARFARRRSARTVGHPARNRGVRPPSSRGRSHRSARDRGADAEECEVLRLIARGFRCRDRAEPRRQRDDREDACRARVDEDGPPRSRPGGRDGYECGLVQPGEANSAPATA